MHLTILGNSSGGPFHGRHYSAQILQVDNQVFLIDCGEGTQMQIFKYRIKFDRCNHFFISHLHGDHVFGLMGLLTNWCLKRRTETLHLYSPPGLRELIETTTRVCGVRFTYALEFHEVDASVSSKVFENQKVEVWTIPLDHRAPTSGWLFREKLKPRNIRPDKIEEYGISFTLIPGIKAGNDLVLPDGRIVPNAELTLDPPQPATYAYCSDTAPSQTVAETVQGVDLLYHEATFTNEHTEEATIAYHSTAAQAAEIARLASVGKLILGHISGRYSDEEQHLIEAKSIFPDTEIALEGHRWEVSNLSHAFLMDAEEKLAMHPKNDVPTVNEQSNPVPKNVTETSKFLSLILRHNPGKIGLSLDPNGWANVEELLQKAADNGIQIDRNLLQIVVDTNNKKRFALSDDGLRIRASQGHSIDIDLDLQPQAPPDILYHGTAEKSLDLIRQEGLRSMKRRHVHLSKDKETARNVGGRHGKPIILTVRAAEMAEAGYLFFLSDNGVWLTEVVPTEYLSFAP